MPLGSYSTTTISKGRNHDNKLLSFLMILRSLQVACGRCAQMMFFRSTVTNPALDHVCSLFSHTCCCCFRHCWSTDNCSCLSFGCSCSFFGDLPLLFGAPSFGSCCPCPLFCCLSDIVLSLCVLSKSVLVAAKSIVSSCWSFFSAFNYALARLGA